MLLTVAAGVCAPALALAQSDSWSGSATLGVRSVDVGGRKEKFLEDINLEDGVRLLDLRFSYAPSAASEAPLDRIELDAHGLGGDPFESVHLGVRKYGTYNLRLDHRRSQYFYEDTILPAAMASITGSTGGDFHHFDFQRIRDTADLDIDLSPATQLSLGLEHQTREGDSTTTLDLQRDEFELDKPLDESMNALTIGVRHNWQRVTLIAEEQRHDFVNTSEVFLPGASPGANTADPAALDFFMLDQSYDYASRGHSVRVVAKPTPRLDVTAAWHREDLELDMDANESSQGTAFDGTPFVTAFAGPAAVDRDLTVADVQLGLALAKRVRFVAAARRSTLHQAGDQTYGADVGASRWDIDTDGFEIGTEILVSTNLTVSAGWSAEARDARYGWSQNALLGARQSQTDRAGFFTRLLFVTSAGLEVTASIEDNSIDDPFALASPTSSKRYKVGARRRWENGLSLTGNYRKTDVENDRSGWLADTEQADLRLVYQRTRLLLSAGYTRIDLARSIDQLVTAGTRQELFSIAYDAAPKLRDASARWQLNRRFTIGGDLRSYDNRGSFSVARDDYRAFLDLALGQDYVLTVAYRDLDYVESTFDEYDAQIVEVGLQLKW